MKNLVLHLLPDLRPRFHSLIPDFTTLHLDMSVMVALSLLSFTVARDFASKIRAKFWLHIS
jgi:hypothetical protein